MPAQGKTVPTSGDLNPRRSVDHVHRRLHILSRDGGSSSVSLAKLRVGGLDPSSKTYWSQRYIALSRGPPTASTGTFISQAGIHAMALMLDADCAHLLVPGPGVQEVGARTRSDKTSCGC
jgi:hypothetical protein